VAASAKCRAQTTAIFSFQAAKQLCSAAARFQLGKKIKSGSLPNFHHENNASTFKYSATRRWAAPPKPAFHALRVRLTLLFTSFQTVSICAIVLVL
jgi:hypothetical protein